MFKPVFLKVKQLRPYGHPKNNEEGDYLALLEEDKEWEEAKVEAYLKSQLVKRNVRQTTLKDHQAKWFIDNNFKFKIIIDYNFLKYFDLFLQVFLVALNTISK